MSESVCSSFERNLEKSKKRYAKNRGSCRTNLTLYELSEFSVKRNPAFDAWIDLYAGEAFEQRVKEYIELVDCECAESSPDVSDVMTNHFIIACKLEHMFWDQALAFKKWPSFENN